MRSLSQIRAINGSSRIRLALPTTTGKQPLYTNQVEPPVKVSHLFNNQLVNIKGTCTAVKLVDMKIANRATTKGSSINQADKADRTRGHS